MIILFRFIRLKHVTLQIVRLHEAPAFLITNVALINMVFEKAKISMIGMSYHATMPPMIGTNCTRVITIFSFHKANELCFPAYIWPTFIQS